MKSAKDEVREVLDMLPDDCTIEDIQYTLYVRESIRAGEADIDAGRIHTQEEIESIVAEWLTEEDRTP